MSAIAIELGEVFVLFPFKRNSPPIMTTAKIIIRVVFVLVIENYSQRLYLCIMRLLREREGVERAGRGVAENGLRDCGNEMRGL